MIVINDYRNQTAVWTKRTQNFYNKAYCSEFKEVLRNKDIKVLDIGFGEGQFLFFLENFGVKDIYGVEVDKSLYYQVKSKIARAKLCNSDGLNYLKDTNVKFDLIFLIDVLEHVNPSEIIELLRLAGKALKKEGCVIVRTVNSESVLTANYMRYIDITHNISFSQDSIRTIFYEAGFRNINIRPQRLPTGFLFVLIKMFRFVWEVFIKMVLLMYLGEKAMKSIQTPNMIVYAKK